MRIIRLQTMGIVLILAIVLPCLICFATSRIGYFFGSLLGILAGFFEVFIGMGIQWMRTQNEIEQRDREFVLQKMRYEADLRTLEKEKHNAICLIKIVADNVANRMIGKYVDNLSSVPVRRKVIREVNAIVREEIDNFF